LIAFAGFVVLGTPGTGGRRGFPQRALAPAFFGMSAIQCATGVLIVIAGGPEPALAGLRTVSVGILLAIQLAASSQRDRSQLEASRERLERLVEERTAALRESEERHRVLANLTSDYGYALRLGPDGSFTFDWVTPSFTRELGYDVEQLESQWYDIVVEEQREQTARELERVLHGESKSFEVTLVTRRGERRTIALVYDRVEPLSDGSVRVVAAGRDVTDQRRAEEERRRMDQHMQEVQRLDSLGVLAGGLAHDFNNMLAVIRGNAELARRELEAGGSPEPRLQRIEAAARHAAGLTSQMLMYAGEDAVSLRALDLCGVVSGMRDLLHAVSAKCVLEIDLAEDLPAIDGDATRLRQVLLNLVTNAVQAQDETDGWVRVRTGTLYADEAMLAEGYGAAKFQPGPHVFLDISDAGPGIAEEVGARVFEPFYTSRREGRGLGLAAVLGIVRSHGAVIEAHNASAGGAVFRVLFPISGAAPGATLGVPRRVTRPQAGDAAAVTGTILIVEDDEAVAEVAAAFLEQAGFEVLTASCGRAGVERLESEPAGVDAVVLDLVLPDMSGGDACVEMRRIRPELPVVLTSGFDREQAMKRFTAGGFVSFLPKPYEPEDLVAHVRSAVLAGR
jgi:PAS domain S-box-containing protein